MNRIERTIWIVLILAALAAAYALPESVLNTDLCVFKKLTGLDCPLCGMTRSMHAAARLDFAASAEHHILGPPLFVLLLLAIPFLGFKMFATETQRLKQG